MTQKINVPRVSRRTVAVAVGTLGILSTLVGVQGIAKASCPHQTAWDPGYGTPYPCNANGHCVRYKKDDMCGGDYTGYYCFDAGQQPPGYQWSGCSGQTCNNQWINGNDTTHHHMITDQCGS
jgi:hypothetical protein